MVKRRVCVVVTARPSYSRIRTALLAIKEHPDLELQLVVAASALLDRYGNTIKVIESDGFIVDASVFTVLEGENLLSMAKTTGIGIMELSTAFYNLQPDMIITIADRFETIATAIAAAYMNIPLVHIQGGEVTGSIDEKVRHAITKLADFHCVSNQYAAERVVRMGENPDIVAVTGCPSIDIAAQILEAPDLNFDPYEKYGGVGSFVNLEEGYLVVMQHPVTTQYEDARKHIIETLSAIKEIGTPTLWFWPNVDAGSDGTSKGIRSVREQEEPPNIHFFKSMEPQDFLRLLYNSKGIVGNSSVAIRECSFLGVPAVNIGDRQAGRDRGKNVIDVNYARKEIIDAIQFHLNHKVERDMLYGMGDAGQAIANLLVDIPLNIEKRLTY